MAPQQTELLLLLIRQHETVIPGELPLVQELTSTLREWAVIWRKLYVVSCSGLLAGSGVISGFSACGSTAEQPLWGVSPLLALCREWEAETHSHWQPAASMSPLWITGVPSWWEVSAITNSVFSLLSNLLIVKLIMTAVTVSSFPFFPSALNCESSQYFCKVVVIGIISISIPIDIHLHVHR